MLLKISEANTSSADENLSELPDAIHNEKDVYRLIAYLHAKESVSFHPDTPFSDYINLQTDEQTYTARECRLREALVNDCFRVCGDTVYDIAMEIMCENLKVDQK